ncbi:MAG TPA: WD40 repeat domain-containing protein, partial [Gemmataceae bacterium]|nr:WD40 repeat domain-containing protein [Gemmataceae bacterium]
IWDLESQHDPVREIKRRSGPPLGYAVFRPGANQVLTGPSRDEYYRFDGKSVSLWDVDSGTHLADLLDEGSLATSPVHKELLGDLRDLDMSPDGERLATVHKDANPRSSRDEEPRPSPLYTPVRVWDLRTGKQLFALQGLRRSVATARFSPDGGRLLTFSDGSSDYAILLDGKKVGGGGGGQLWARVDLWDAHTGQHLRSFVPESKGGGDFAIWSRDGKRVLTDALAHMDKVDAKLFDPDTGERVGRLKSDSAGMDRAAFSPDGKLVLGYRVHYLRNQLVVEVWDAATGAKRFSLRGHTGNITSAVFSPDSSLVLTTSLDGTARLWDVADGQTRRVLTGHRHVVRTGRFSPDGKWIVTASNDGTARIWSTETGQEWMTLPAAQGEMVSAEFSSDSQRVLTVSTDGLVRIWPVDPLPVAATRKPRELTADERARFQIE